MPIALSVHTHAQTIHTLAKRHIRQLKLCELEEMGLAGWQANYSSIGIIMKGEWIPSQNRVISHPTISAIQPVQTRVINNAVQRVPIWCWK